MKKIVLLGAMTLGSMAFANQGKEADKAETKTENKKEVAFAGCKQCYTASCGGGSTTTCYTDPGGDCDKALKMAKKLSPCSSFAESE